MRRLRQAGRVAVPPPDCRVAVVDVSGYGLAPTLVAALAAAGVPAVATEDLPLSGPTVLILPVLLDEHVPSTGTALMRLQDRASAPEEERRGRLTVLWAVRRHERLAVATPHNGDLTGSLRRAAFNASLLLAGDAWQRELALHHGVVPAALSCVSSRVERLLRADSHRQIAGDDADMIRSDARKVDRQALHAVCVEVRPAAKEIIQRWAGWSGVVAAVAWQRAGGPG